MKKISQKNKKIFSKKSKKILGKIENITRKSRKKFSEK